MHTTSVNLVLVRSTRFERRPGLQSKVSQTAVPPPNATI